MSENEQTADPSQELQDKLDACEEKYLRLLAESENARKRMQKEKHELTQYAIENALSEVIQPIDNFRQALDFAEGSSEEVKNWAVGFEMIIGQFKQVLSGHGIEEYSSAGKHFDPHFHEAVEMVETADHKPGIIVEELVSGYKKGDRAIRVARVKVAKAPVEESEKKEGEENE
ncbi:MAG: Protein GrpE [Chlamydiales bacterium]|nr:Protein GrpE [Chlamydiales bacterium]MCH9620037.1 Protein GrpE [Chlamydiales bacterium]MCH9622860.1 Protein GrpE [Chlamydiales bacterium]